MRFGALAIVVLGVVATVAVSAQAPPQAGRGAGRGGGATATPVTALRSPEVNVDRTVTLRFRAPQATQVDLVGEILQGGPARPMTKDENGVWTVTVGPLPPEIWIYNFRVQGVDLPDPSNPSIKPTPPGFAMSSFVEVPGDEPSFYDSRPVPHGDVRMMLYESKAMGVTRWLWVYTPPGYDRGTARYPVLYLLHGNGEAHNGWVMNGRANIILDNLIADRKAVPMIVVMPQGHALQGAGVGPLERLSGETTMFSDRFPRDLLDEVVPLVEKSYRVYPDADHRAIAGLSMGGGQALTIGLSNTDRFHYVLGFSAAIGGQIGVNYDFVKAIDPAAINRRLKLLWVSCGREDFLYESNRQFNDVLSSRGIKATFQDFSGRHVWSIWRHNLNDAAPLLFR